MRLNTSKGGLVGILIIILILSSLLVLSIRREDPGSPVYLARNDHPSEFKSTQARGETMVFSLGLICKEAFEELEVRYLTLFMTPEPEFADADFSPNASDPITIMEARKDIKAIRENLGNVTIPFDVLNVSAVAGNQTHKREFSGVIYDFSRTLGLFLNRSILGQISLVYGVLRDEGGETLYFSGVPDFFYRREQNLKYLSIHHNQNETTYEERTDITTNVNPIPDAPAAGSIAFTSTEADDQILIQMNVESTLSTLPHRIIQTKYRQYVIQHVRVYANGRLEVNEMNLIPFEQGGWSL